MKKRRHHAPKRFKLRSTDPPEVELHKSVADFLDWCLLPPSVWTTFPAGWGKLPITTAARLKACGLKPGFPDIMVWRPDGRMCGVELKKPGEKPNLDQNSVHWRLKAIHVPVFVCCTLEEVNAALIAFNVPLRRFKYQGADHASQSDEGDEARGAQEPAQGTRTQTTDETVGEL